MKTDCAYNRCLQISFILIQILFIILGGVLVGLGVWFEIIDQNFEEIVDGDQILYGAYIVIAAGCAIIIVAAIGIFGAVCDYKVNRFLLFLYIILVIVVFVVQTAGAILAFVFREEALDFVRDGLEQTITEYNISESASNRQRAITEAWDFVQEEVTCCGINNFTDWNLNFMFENSWPASCCEPGTAVPLADPPCNQTDVFNEGCEEALTDFIQENLLIVATVAITFVVAEVIVVLMAICLLCCTEYD
jgi:hypothetical protein